MVYTPSFAAEAARLLASVKVSGVAQPQHVAAAGQAPGQAGGGAVDAEVMTAQLAMLARQTERLQQEAAARRRQQQQEEEGVAGGVPAAAGPTVPPVRSEDNHDSSGEESDGSDTETFETPTADQPESGDSSSGEAATSVHQRQRGAQVFFTSGSAEDWYYVYREALQHRAKMETAEEVLQTKQDIEALAAPQAWAVFMCTGGHFAGVLFRAGKVLHHKCFHRYVVRAKRGTVQSVRDGKSGTSQPKSGGASLRRYNEAMLDEDIRGLLRSWKPYIDECRLVFIQTPVRGRALFFSTNVITKGDPRVRHVPFPTHRPTLKEATRVYSILSAVYHTDKPEMLEDAPPTEAAVKEQPAQESQPTAPQEPEVDPDAYSNSKLYLACRDGNLDAARALLSDDSVEAVGYAWNDNAETALHAAAQAGAVEVVAALLVAGCDPAIKDARGRVPYVTAKDKETRDAFRRHMAQCPEAFDYAAAQVPSALTEDLEQKQLAKEKQQQERAKKRAAKKARQKRKQAEKADREREEAEAEAARLAAEEAAKPKLSKQAAAREARAAAAMARLNPKGRPGQQCSYCGAALRVKFHRFDYVYCSVKCMNTHKVALDA